MANPTTNFGWQMPTSTDLVTDLPADFEVFGQAVDTALVDLKGGTTGQVLSKTTDTDMDFTWVTSDDANAIQNAIVDAKGDLIAATAADTPARLAVGANDTLLVAASGETTGLKWGGGFTTHSPTFKQSTTTITQSGGTFRYAQIGKFVHSEMTVAFSGTGVAGNAIVGTLPVSCKTAGLMIGNGQFYDASSFNVYPFLIYSTTANDFQLAITDVITTNGSQYVGVTGFTAAVANGDQMWLSLNYEAA
jgi:hypothetical protein